MSSFDLGDLTKKMVGAAGGVLKEGWKETKPYAEQELRKIADAIDYIRREVTAGRMTPNKARLHLQLQKNAAATVLLTASGLQLLAVEQAINAALDIVKDTVNSALRFPLL